MSNKNHQDEMWLTTDGREIPVNELSEHEAKEALRMLIKMDREERTYYDTHIVPAITALTLEMGSMADKIEAELGVAKQTSLSDVDAIFNKAGEDWNGNKE